MGNRFVRTIAALLASWAMPAAATDYVYPLKVSANGRYLVDQTDRPWRIQADAGWYMTTEATEADVDAYLATRKAQGFNSFYLMVIVSQGGPPHAPNNRNGDMPFATPGVFATVEGNASSVRYWQWIDLIVAKAAAQNMVVMFSYTYLGFQGDGWYPEIVNQPGGRQACFNWGVWLGNRYKNKPNILWFTLGDYTPPFGSEGEARTLEIIRGIKSTGATQLFMAEPSGGNSNPIMDAPAFAPFLDMNSFYGYGYGAGECYPQAARAYGVTPPKPAWVQEGGYEYDNLAGRYQALSFETRRTRFWAVLGGGTAGDGFGNSDVYQWREHPQSMMSPGARYSTLAFDLFATFPWWDLRPSGTEPGFAGKNLIVSGEGDYNDLDYVTSALTADGQYLMAYIPTEGGTNARTITVDMTALSGPSRARWWNPATGVFTSIATGLPNTGTRAFTSPGASEAPHSGAPAGTNDWILFLSPTSNALHTLAPCRLVDTRQAGGALAAGSTRIFTLTGTCGVPADARSVAVNLTVTQATGAGNLRAFPDGTPVPLASVVNFSAGQTRANSAVLPLGPGGRVAIRNDMPQGSVHFIVDVSAYLK